MRQKSKWAQVVDPPFQPASQPMGLEAAGELSAPAGPWTGSWSVPLFPTPQWYCQQERSNEVSPDLEDKESQHQMGGIVSAEASHPERYLEPHTSPPLKCPLEYVFKTRTQLEKAVSKSVILRVHFLVEGCAGWRGSGQSVQNPETQIVRSKNFSVFIHYHQKRKTISGGK